MRRSSPPRPRRSPTSAASSAAVRRPGAGHRPRIVVATHSRHKLGELRELLAPAGVELISLDEAGVEEEPDETGATFATNAAIKARYAARRTGMPALADDSGLEVEALDGAPGVRTRRYAGPAATDADNNAKLLGALDGLPPARRSARYVCVLALALPAQVGVRGGLPVVLRRGTCRGRIATEPRGTNGFGYDPIFEPASEPPGGRTLGLWSSEEKHRISHRARAVARMAPLLAELPPIRERASDSDTE